MPDVRTLVHLFRCPDCRDDLDPLDDALRCRGCARRFPIHRDVCVDFVSRRRFERPTPTALERRADATYRALRDEPFSFTPREAPWGLATFGPVEALHRAVVVRLLPPRAGVSLDVSAGSGRFSWGLLDRSDLVIFSDVSVAAAVHLTGRVLDERRDNAIVLRADYTAPPLRPGSVDLCLAQDTLIYGRPHELRLLSTVNELLAPAGRAIVDFANVRHRGFWHAPYTCAYTRREVDRMLAASGLRAVSEAPFHQELAGDPEGRRLRSRLLRRVLPCTRFVLQLGLASEAPRQARAAAAS